MINEAFYYTIDKPSVGEFRDRGSRFIAYTFPIEDIAAFKDKLAVLKKEHPKAAHHCFAYRLGLDNFSYRVSDDGEPSGSAGRPILGQVDSKQLTNILVVVVRYFGGTLLGVPGLINAYKTSTALALENASVIKRAVLVYYHIQFDYTLMNEVMRVLKKFECKIGKQEMQLFCFVETGIPTIDAKEVVSKLSEIKGIVIEKVNG